MEPEGHVNKKEQTDLDVYSLIITRRGASELLCLLDGPYSTLPSVEIRRWERTAEQINAAVYRQLKIEAYCLSTCLPTSPTGASPAICLCAMECVRPETVLLPKMRWVSANSLAETSFLHSTTLATIQNVLRMVRPDRRGENGEYFGTSGSLREISEWIRAHVGPLNLRLTGQFQQLTVSPHFCLMRFETNGPALWFKAVGEPNTREFTISRNLAELFPDFLPQVLAVCPQWNAWLMTEAVGVAPDASSGFSAWRAIVDRLAELQTDSVPCLEILLAAGCRNSSAEFLLNLVDEFLAVMEELMTRQHGTPPPVLTRHEIIALANPLKDALSLLAESLVPNALNHLDLNPGNIRVSADQCVFLDWAEAAVGPPFLTLEYLLEHFRQCCPTIAQRRAQLTGRYMNHWRPYVAENVLSQCLRASPLAAVFAYAVSNDIWRNNVQLTNPQTAGYFRSLTRRISREASAFAQRSSQCLSQ